MRQSDASLEKSSEPNWALFSATCRSRLAMLNLMDSFSSSDLYISMYDVCLPMFLWSFSGEIPVMSFRFHGR